MTSAPPTGDTTVEPDGAGDGGPSLSIPRLPVGGSGTATTADADLQCAVVNWSAVDPGASLDLGVGLRVTGFRVDTAHFQLVPNGCPAEGPTCQGFVFGGAGGGRVCAIAVRTVRPQPDGPVDTDLLLAGTGVCYDTEATRCADVVAAVAAAGVTEQIQLEPPSTESTAGTPSDQTTTSDQTTASADPSWPPSPTDGDTALTGSPSADGSLDPDVPSR